jgi:hypothetical protein
MVVALLGKCGVAVAASVFLYIRIQQSALVHPAAWQVAVLLTSKPTRQAMVGKFSHVGAAALALETRIQVEQARCTKYTGTRLGTVNIEGILICTGADLCTD